MSQRFKEPLPTYPPYSSDKSRAIGNFEMDAKRQPTNTNSLGRKSNTNCIGHKTSNTNSLGRSTLGRSNTKGRSNKGRGRALKITVVGDGMVGKTCLLYTYTSKEFPVEYVPTVFDNYSGTITVDNQDYDITLWDTAGQENYERLRPISYPNTDCFIVCYSINSRASYENIFTKWHPELQHHCPKVPSILVATKADLRDSDSSITISSEENSKLSEVSRPTKSKKQMDLVSRSQGRKMARKIGASKFVECSALKYEGLDEVFVAAVRSALKTNGLTSCAIL